MQVILPEVYTPYITLTPGQWYSIDYPISYFTSKSLDCKKIGAIRFGDDDGTKYSKEIYVDNIYFFTGTAKNPYVQSGINDINMESAVNAFPTEVVDMLAIESQENIETASIINLIGQPVKHFDVNGLKTELNLSDLRVGSYILNVKLSSGKYANKKIVKL
ncbi:MAG: T9SS type A sorting domain-containing protein [Paludibacter sp.]